MAEVEGTGTVSVDPKKWWGYRGRPNADNFDAEKRTRGCLGCDLPGQTREGICRLGPELAKELGTASHRLFDEVAPGAEWLATQLMHNPDHPTPLTRKRHRESRRSPS